MDASKAIIDDTPMRGEWQQRRSGGEMEATWMMFPPVTIERPAEEEEGSNTRMSPGSHHGGQISSSRASKAPDTASNGLGLDLSSTIELRDAYQREEAAAAAASGKAARSPGGDHQAGGRSVGRSSFQGPPRIPSLVPGEPLLPLQEGLEPGLAPPRGEPLRTFRGEENLPWREDHTHTNGLIPGGTLQIRPAAGLCI